jgi:hypothetical protein
VVRNTTIPGARILYGGTSCVWALSMERASCTPYGALNCKVAAKFFLKIYSSWVQYIDVSGRSTLLTVLDGGT